MLVYELEAPFLCTKNIRTMKKLLLLGALCAQTAWLSAQIFVDGIKLEPSNTGQYVELDPRFDDQGGCIVAVDYGQNTPKNDLVTDARGQRFEFHSLVECLNIFYQEGWVVDQISVLERGGRKFLLKRRY